MHLLLLVFAFVCSCAAVYVAGPGVTWQRAMGLALAFLIASMISW